MITIMIFCCLAISTGCHTTSTHCCCTAYAPSAQYRTEKTHPTAEKKTVNLVGLEGQEPETPAHAEMSGFGIPSIGTPYCNSTPSLGRRMFAQLKDDARGVANWNNAAILGVALGGSLALRGDIDNEVRHNVRRHPKRWGDLGETIGFIGDGRYHFPAILALYGYGVHQEKDELREVTGTMLSALSITGLSTVTIKGIYNTERPSKDFNNGEYGFPSSHASSSFATAAVLDEYYGPRAGLPAYALAGMISWSRIDDQDHDLSDVVFGAALGWVIGKSVARNNLCRDTRVNILPYVHPTEATSGVMFEVPF